MASSGDAATTTGCFSAILSRVLCSGNLPTHSSEHLPQLTSTESTHQPKSPLTESKPIIANPSSTPGIVARLMGLDPFPNTPSFPQRPTLDSIIRSRSVNYVDFYLPNLEKAQEKAQYEAHDQAQHRRVSSSVSFRDVGPTFLDPQNHELLILCLDQVDEISRKAELSLKGMVSDVKKNKKSCKIKEEKPNKDINGPSLKPNVEKVLGQKGDFNARSASLNRKSPVRPMVSREEKSGELKSREKREAQMPENSGPKLSKKSPIRLDKYDHPCPNLTSRLKQDDHQELKASKSMSKTNMLMEVCRLIEEDTEKGFVWMTGKDLKLEKIDEMCFELEQEVLEMLLIQFVDELCTQD